MMERVETARADQHLGSVASGVRRNGTPLGTRSRPRVDGKFFSCGERRLRIQGVSYGPFAANPDGEPFPEPDRVGDDFARMRAAGINSIRTYHVPPDWLLDRADEQGIGVLVDAPW